MSVLSKEKQIQHLYLRAGFGVDYHTRMSALTLKDHVNLLFVKSSEVNALSLLGSSLEKQKLSEESLKYGKELNILWLSQMTYSQAVLREKMTLFWHGHFACRSNNPFFAQELNNIQRLHALGKFRDLLLAVSKSPAMLEFLNNQQNRKQHPNENFARELMELFTLGHGNYTEQDIRESARSFTGWGFDKEANFTFRVKQHDEGDKIFFGKTGNYTGENIIDMLLERKETAWFICSKLYRFFVNDKIDEDIVREMAETFYKTDYDISALMKSVLLSGWFYDKKNVGIKIKSPIELLLGLNRSFDIKYEDPNVLLHIQKVLGQVLFSPPNVGGWPGGKSWIDSSSLMFRLKLPSVVLNNGIIEVEAKDEPEEYKIQMQQEEERIQKKVQKKVKANAGWDTFRIQVPKEISKGELADFLLQQDPPGHMLDLVMEPGGENIKNSVIALLSMPEYQMC